MGLIPSIPRINMALSPSGIGRTEVSVSVAPVVTYDTDAQTWITAVEAADGQTLETAVKTAVNNLVLTLKAGDWNNIHTICLFSAARSLSGIAVPLKGTAPTVTGFSLSALNRKTGLIATGADSSQNVNHNVARNVFGQDSFHMAVYASTVGTILASRGLMGAGAACTIINSGNTNGSVTINSGFGDNVEAGKMVAGFIGAKRSSANDVAFRGANSDVAITRASNQVVTANITSFAREVGASSTDSRLSIACFGNGSVNLSAMETAFTAYMAALSAATLS